MNKLEKYNRIIEEKFANKTLTVEFFIQYWTKLIFYDEELAKIFIEKHNDKFKDAKNNIHLLSEFTNTKIKN